MEKLIINGGKRICGEIKIGGAKNAVLPLLAAAMLTDKTVVLTNCPMISDVKDMLDILEKLGCKTSRENDTITVNTKNAYTHIMPENESRKMRSSIFMLGSMISRFGKVCAVYPGGCDIGSRPIDLHLHGLRALGVVIEEKDGKIYCDGSNMRAGRIHLGFPSVGATENLMMAASSLEGETVIENAACEPEIVDLQNFMRSMGINISGAGTPIITISGRTDSPNEILEHRVIPDRIVTGTLLCAAAITGGSITLHDSRADHCSAVISKLQEMGCRFDIKYDTISMNAERKLVSVSKIETMPYPGFPTDMQALMLAVCTVCDGTSIITENLYENRFRHVPELIKMGASIVVKDRTAIVTGGKLHGAAVSACDLRAGAALIAAALAAEGTTVVEGVDKYVDRGYDHIEVMLRSLGADIIRAGG